MPLQMIVKTRGTHSQTPNLDDYEKSCADFSWTKARNELNGLPDVNAVETATRAAIERLRAGDGPYLLECRTYRFRAHSMYDPELYRSKEEVEHWKTHCPITALEARLRSEDQFLDQRRAEMETAIATEIEKAVAFAEAGPWEPVEDLLKDVLTLEQGKD